MKKSLFIILFLLTSTGIILSSLATRWGVGLFADSVYLLQAARSLSAGQGVSLPSPEGGLTPLTSWPPLFPTLVFAMAQLGVPLPQAARMLNILIFAANIALVGMIIYTFTHSIWLSGFGSMLMMSALDMLRVHSYAASEPLYILLGLLGLVFLGRYFEQPETKNLIISGFALGLACLDRYAGLFLVTTGVIGFLILYKTSFLKKVKPIAFFLLASCSAVLIWMLRNYTVSGTLTGAERSLVYHPVPWEKIQHALQVVATWWFPLADGSIRAYLSQVLPGANSIINLVLMGVFVSIVSFVALGLGSARKRASISHWLSGHPPLKLLAVFPFVYLALLFISISLLDFNIPLDWRTLSPIYAPILIVLIGLMPQLVRAIDNPRIWQLTTTGALVIAGLYLAAAGAWVWRAHQEGLGYGSLSWQNSPLLQEVKALPDHWIVYTNGAEAVNLVAGKPAAPLPSKIDVTTNRENITYSDQFKVLQSRLNNGEAVVVYLNAMAYRRYYPTEDELMARLDLHPLVKSSEGAVYIRKP